jgi:hypothetical protein
MIDLVGEFGPEIPERIVRQRCEMDDSVQPVEIAELHVASVLADVRHLYDAATGGEGAALIEITVESDHLVAGPQQLGNHDGSDIAQMSRHHYAHCRFSRASLPSCYSIIAP